MNCRHILSPIHAFVCDIVSGECLFVVAPTNF